MEKQERDRIIKEFLKSFKHLNGLYIAYHDGRIDKKHYKAEWETDDIQQSIEERTTSEYWKFSEKLGITIEEAEILINHIW